MSERVGVYVCHCGTNIAGTVDVKGVARWAETLPGVTVARDYKFMCSSAGQELIEEDIKELGLTRVVVAACSPHLHEKTFRRACANAGLNPFLCQMCNIREHVSWTTINKGAATEKARAMVSGAVGRVVHQEPLEPTPVPVNPATLVVGGGIAGIQAALELADAGYPVYLVEREPSIGGHMAQFDKTFPTLDCSACILMPKMSDVGQHDKITLLSYSEVEEVSGFVGNFRVRVRKKARYVDETLCTGCGVCVEKCPWKVMDDVFEAGYAKRKVIYTPFPQAVPKYPVLDRPNCVYFQKGTCRACQKFCPTGAIDFEQEDEILTLEVGNIILAIGYDLFDCSRVSQYGFGRLPNVITSLQFERMCNAAGPTGGKIVLRDGVTEPQSVAILHCVGSRDENHNRYCSAVCCMTALKFGHLVRDNTGAEVYSFYIDMRTPHKNYEEFYHRLLGEGIHFIRGKAAEVTNVARGPEEEGKLIIQAEDTLLGRQRRVPVDMVILMGALEPRADSREVGLRFGISCSMDGWFTERHPKLDPVATMTDGVFIAGVCQGPKDIPDSVAQGAAAAARVGGMITKGTVWMEPVVATINQAWCSGCRICNNLCPFNAIEFIADDQVSYINPVLCKGCGTCVAACPAAAITGAHFNNQQVLSEIEGLLWDALDGHVRALEPVLTAVGQRMELQRVPELLRQEVDMLDTLASYRHLATLEGGVSVLLRPLTKADKEQLVALFANAHPEDLDYFRSDAKDPAVVAAWCDDLDYHKVFPLVPVVNNQIVGNGILQIGSGYSRHLGWVRLFLDRAHRRRGIGRLMLAGLVDIARKAGLQQLVAEVVTSQTPVIKAFQSLGFEQVFVNRDFFMTPQGETLDVALLILRLVESDVLF